MHWYGIENVGTKTLFAERVGREGTKFHRSGWLDPVNVGGTGVGKGRKEVGEWGN